MDNYFSKCLDLITNCSSGIGIAINITLMDPPDSQSNYKNVLLSSGGDSPYSIGGFYLHQYNANGDKYLEFGVSNVTSLYATRVRTPWSVINQQILNFCIFFKINVSTNDSMKLVFVWNSDGLSSYVDGKLFSTVANPVKRSYLDVRFKPIHNTKFLVEKLGQTIFWSINFYDTAKEAFDSEVTSTIFISSY
jgi:hypothetical protein